MTIKSWPEPPTAGDIVWCHFPGSVRPRPKPRPALVLDVFGLAVPYAVRVAYGTSKRVRELHSGEFAILRANHPAAYALANLSYDAKFDLRQLVEFPCTSQWFSVPPHAPHGQSPRLGTLHPSLMRTASAAYRATAAPARRR